ncbi:MAG: hypothetical protein JWN13_3612 [Betaproteobacteria bacterium]|nr:hypothetical protein [Betaproteobacteria bacterium]
MGLLSSILGGIAGNALGRSSGMGGLRGLGRGGGRSSILLALLPVVLSMLANRRANATMGRNAMPGVGLGTGAGGLGGLGGLGALAGLGGLGALLHRFQEKGFGDQVQSWVGTGANQPIEPEALSQVFGSDELSKIASQAGVTEDEARTGLSQLLPQVVDHLTPHGQLPDPDQVSSSIDEAARELQEQTQ